MEIIALERSIIFDIFSIGWWIIAVILLIKNLITHERTAFALGVNVITLFLISLPYLWYKLLFGIFDLWYIDLASLSTLLIFILVGFKWKLNMKQGLKYFEMIIIIHILLISLKFMSSLSAGGVFPTVEESLHDDFIEYLKYFSVQINLVIAFINANRDCFNKKSEKILGSKE